MNVQDIVLVVLCTAAIDDAAYSTYNVLQNSTRFTKTTRVCLFVGVVCPAVA